MWLAGWLLPVDWLAALVPDALHNAIERLAHEERRSISNMARVLFEEALRARGIDWEHTARPGTGWSASQSHRPADCAHSAARAARK